jgi:hypothetical protein
LQVAIEEVLLIGGATGVAGPTDQSATKST